MPSQRPDKLNNRKARWRIETVIIKEESEGPDFYTDYEIHVIDNLTEKIVRKFSGSSSNGICYSYTQGTKYVALSENETYLIVVDGEDHEDKIPLTE